MKIENNISVSAPQDTGFALNSAQLYGAKLESNKNKEVNSNSAVQDYQQNNTSSVLDAVASKIVGVNTSLIIEKDPNRAGFIYKTIDKTTGQIVKIWPQEKINSELESLHDSDAIGIMLNKRA